MKSYDEYGKTAKDQQAFSNGTEWEIWSYNVCMGGNRPLERRCVNDDEADEGNGCPLILLALNGMTPVEWMGARGEAKDVLFLSCTEKTLPADARRAAREADTAAQRDALDASHYPMFPEVHP